MQTLNYTMRRVLLSLIVLIGISLITFLIVRVVPSNPAAVYLGPKATPEQIEKLNDEMGFNRPLPEQYMIYMQKMVQGDLGVSLKTHRDISADFGEYVPNSFELLLLSLFFSAVVGIPLGVISAYYKGKWVDQITRVISIFGVSVPSFWIALVLQYVCFTKLNLLPINGQMSVEVSLTNPVASITGFKLLDSILSGNGAAFLDMVPHYVLPVLTLSLYPFGLLVRMTRSNVIDVLGSDYIRLAKAYRIPMAKMLFHYALKNSAGPILTVLGLMFAFSVTGAFFVEVIYNWPGIGSYSVAAILSLDNPAIMAVTLLIAIVYVLTNLITDLLQAWLDPRIRLGEE
ncbi:ABC transporter permease [Brevibacillus fluminis]|uniref:ABC transporter permease n=1 Tax=Brevibacillus fluminis TaxID=511487 RepID=A0A3M8DU71_9BACL|nr:ABC transporter permease [Brevibacillus fluminis]RNB91646.1 ABC transporter permease [Brevibacillus fluminis]